MKFMQRKFTKYLINTSKCTKYNIKILHCRFYMQNHMQPLLVLNNKT